MTQTQTQQKKFDTSALTEKAMVEQLLHHADQFQKAQPDLADETKKYKDTLTATDPASAEKRGKMLQNYKNHPELVEDLFKPRDAETYKAQAAGRRQMTEPFRLADEKTAADVTAALKGGGAGPAGAAGASSGFGGFLSNLTSGGGGGLGGLGDIFKKLSEMLTKFLSSLGFGGAKGGPTQGATPSAKPNTPAGATPTATPTPAPKPGPAQPAPQQTAQQKPEASTTAQSKDPSKDQPKDQPQDGAQKTAASDESAPEDAASPAGEELAGTDATKPRADEVGKDLGQGAVDPDTAAKAASLKEKLGPSDPTKPLVLPDATKDDQTGAQKTSAGDVPQEWAALQDKFGITPDHLSKLKAPETTVAAANEETIGPRAAQQSTGFKLS